MSAQSRSLSDQLLEAAPDAILLVRADGAIAVANPMAERLFGYTRRELEGLHIELLIPPDLRERHVHNRKTYARNPTVRPMGDRALSALRKDGVVISVEVSLSPMESHEGEMTIAIIRDVSRRIELERQLRYASTHDALTGLLNRTLLDSERSRLETESTPLGVMLVDVDGLKPINDQLGHEAGDEILRRTARVLLSASAPDDLVVRLGGDEFAIVRPHCSAEDLLALRTSVDLALARHNQTHPEPALALSYGTALGDILTPLAHSMRESDERMYAQKRQHASVRPTERESQAPRK